MNIVNVGYSSANYYVLEQNRTHILIDVGWPGTLPRLLANLKRKGLALSDIDCLLATHYHPDHAGLVQEIKNKGVKHLLLDEQLAGIPLLKTYMKSDSGYVEIVTDDSIRLATFDSRSWLRRMGIQGEMKKSASQPTDQSYFLEVKPCTKRICMKDNWLKQPSSPVFTGS